MLIKPAGCGCRMPQLDLNADVVKRALVAAPKLKIKPENVRCSIEQGWLV